MCLVSDPALTMHRPLAPRPCSAPPPNPRAILQAGGRWTTTVHRIGRVPYSVLCCACNAPPLHVHSALDCPPPPLLLPASPLLGSGAGSGRSAVLGALAGLATRHRPGCAHVLLVRCSQLAGERPGTVSVLGVCCCPPTCAGLHAEHCCCSPAPAALWHSSIPCPWACTQARPFCPKTTPLAPSLLPSTRCAGSPHGTVTSALSALACEALQCSPSLLLLDDLEALCPGGAVRHVHVVVCVCDRTRSTCVRGLPSARLLCVHAPHLLLLLLHATTHLPSPPRPTVVVEMVCLGGGLSAAKPQSRDRRDYPLA